jgi:hypothetical protein
MTDRHDTPARGGGEAPPVVPFAPETDLLPPVLDAAGGEVAPVVLLLAAPGERAWAAEAALAIATSWAQAGRRVVLADLDLEEPSLHEAAGEENVDGIADIFLYGASLARSARPVKGRGFYLIPAGTYTPDAADVLRHPRWGRLVAGFREAKASLLLFVPADSPELAALGRWAEEAIVLGEAPERAADRLPESVAIRAALVPPHAAAPPPAISLGITGADAVAPGATALAATDVGAAAESEHAEPQPEQPQPEPEPAKPAWPQSDVLLTVPPEAPRHRAVEHSGGARPLLWGLLAAAIAVGLVYLLIATYRPEMLRREVAPAATPPGALPAPVALKPAARPTGEPLPYSIHVTAYELLSAARQEVAQEAKRLPGTPFYVTPEWRDEKLYYRVLAGLLPDTGQARALRQRLVEVGAVQAENAAGEWSLIELLPLAYRLGEYESEGAAAAHADSLAARDVPAYVVPLSFSDGSERWQLYGGAFRDSASALTMGALLQEKGIPAELVERTGGAPATR